MRKRHAQFLVVIALIAVTTLSVTGQEEPLPTVQARPWSATAAGNAIRYVAIAVEPIREFAPPSIAEAVRRNDYVTFNALYTAGKANGENVRAFDALHELWTWSMSDPIGAFYGAEIHRRLAGAYPGFTAYIEDYRIVDSNGAVFYPTSETRAFLLERALEGRTRGVQIADAAQTRRTAASSQTRTNTPAPATRVTAPAPRPAAATSSASAPATTSRPAPARAAAPERRVAGQETTRTAAKPVASPATKSATTAPANATIVETAAQPIAAATPAVPAIAEVTPPVTTPVIESAPAVAAPIAPVSTSADQRPIARESAFANRGILLLVIGIIGIGLLAVMLRTPKETSMPSILQPPAVPPAEKPSGAKGDGPSAKVEPMRAKGEKRAS